MLHLDATDPGPMMGVAVGALLATMGGLIGGQIENRLNRKEREKSAALLFGEILAGLKLIVRMAADTRGRGEPYGRVTLRVVKAAWRETQVYDRNRETLFAVSNPELRARTHLLLAQMSLTIEAVLETSETIRIADESEAKGEEAKRVAERRAAAVEERHGSFDFMVELAQELPALLASYEKLAGQSLEATDLAVRRGGVGAIAPNPPTDGPE